jgi:hypothetical protein
VVDANRCLTSATTMWQGASKSLISAMSHRFRDLLREAQAEVSEVVVVALSIMIVSLIKSSEVAVVVVGAMSTMIVSLIKSSEEAVVVVGAMRIMIVSSIKVSEVAVVVVGAMSSVIVSLITNDLVRSMNVTSSTSMTEPEVITSRLIIMRATDILVEVEATIAETTTLIVTLCRRMIIKTVVTSTSTKIVKGDQLSSFLESTGTHKTLTPHVIEAATNSLEVVGVDDAVMADKSINHVKFNKNNTLANFMKSARETMT